MSFPDHWYRGRVDIGKNWMNFSPSRKFTVRYKENKKILHFLHLHFLSNIHTQCTHGNGEKKEKTILVVLLLSLRGSQKAHIWVASWLRLLLALFRECITFFFIHSAICVESTLVKVPGFGDIGVNQTD